MTEERDNELTRFTYYVHSVAHGLLNDRKPPDYAQKADLIDRSARRLVAAADNNDQEAVYVMATSLAARCVAFGVQYGARSSAVAMSLDALVENAKRYVEEYSDDVQENSSTE